MEFHDFIGLETAAWPLAFCDRAVACFEQLDAAGLVFDREQLGQGPNTRKDDRSTACTGTLAALERVEGLPALLRDFNERFWGAIYPAYLRAFPILAGLPRQRASAFKLQRTRVGGGYHVWHHEDDGHAHAHRLLAWTLFLNDVEEGGETEFLYQHRRFAPRAGTLLLWPAGFTHAHRGNPPLSGPKFIATGWVEV